MTKWTKLTVFSVAAAMLCVGAMTLRAEDKPADAPADGSAQNAGNQKAGKPRKLVMPWREMTSLSDEQKQQIFDIHKKTNEEKKRLDAQEREEIMALLNDEQKAEAKKLEEEKKVSGKLKAADQANGKAEGSE